MAKNILAFQKVKKTEKSWSLGKLLLLFENVLGQNSCPAVAHVCKQKATRAGAFEPPPGKSRNVCRLNLSSYLARSISLRPVSYRSTQVNKVHAGLQGRAEGWAMHPAVRCQRRVPRPGGCSVRLFWQLSKRPSEVVGLLLPLSLKSLSLCSMYEGWSDSTAKCLNSKKLFYFL